MTRLEAFLLLRRFVREQRSIRVSLATEAIMEDLAGRLGSDPHLWGLAGMQNPWPQSARG